MNAQHLPHPMELRDLIEAVEYAAVSDGRPVLCGVHLENDGDELVAVATDGHRMAIRRTELTKLDLPKGGITITAAGITAIKKTLHRKNRSGVHSAEVAVTSRLLVLTSPGRPSAEAELADGKFPAWRNVVPPKPKAKDVVKLPWPAGELVEAVEALSAFDCKAPIMVELTGRKLHLSRDYKIPGGTVAGNATFDDVRSSEPTKFGVSGYYLADALRSLVGNATFSMKDPDGPIRLADGSGNTAIVMPVRT